MEEMTIPAAAKQLGVSRERVRQLMLMGRLLARRPGHEYLIDGESLKNYVARPRGRPKKAQETTDNEETTC